MKSRRIPIMSQAVFYDWWQRTKFVSTLPFIYHIYLGHECAIWWWRTSSLEKSIKFTQLKHQWILIICMSAEGGRVVRNFCPPLYLREWRNKSITDLISPDNWCLSESSFPCLPVLYKALWTEEMVSKNQLSFWPLTGHCTCTVLYWQVVKTVNFVSDYFNYYG